MEYKIPHLSKCKFIGKKKKDFRIIKFSEIRYRVEYRDRFLFFRFWDTELKKKKEFAGFEDGYNIRYYQLHFPSEELCLQYINKCCRKIICFSKQTETITVK